MKTILFIVLTFVSGFNLAAQNTWKVSSSEVTFQIQNAGLPVKGSFGNATAAIGFDPLTPASSTLTASVDVNSIDTGIGLRNNHLKKDKYFWVEKYPKITMKSVKIVPKGPNNFVGTFALTIKAVTRQVEVPFTYSNANGTQQLQGNFSIDRRDFTVGGDSWTMADQVKISIKVSAPATAL